ncbi:hypothetical protein DPMN_055474 [Dreissena polymorpha]|uniref:Uncharacterized protein n=1 Tax=Dreissena polymorpha TaxID=45954 RepID=A0A9D4CRX7_DREPO|nr:hypothetical protein DPMN_055474 [Dreissena polymorpha]
MTRTMIHLVVREHNLNLRQDDTSSETLDAKEEKEALIDHIHNKAMVREYDRYASFEKYEDKMESISYSTSRLALKGFYYNLEKRLCICFVCGVEVKRWNERESIEETHRKLSPDCRFISGKDTVNIPFHKLAGCCERRMHRGGESLESNSIAGAEACSEELIEQTDRLSKFASNQDASNTETTYTQLSLETATGGQQTKHRDDCLFLAENAKYPKYWSKSERTSSFLCWRRTALVSTGSLVDAGLYYTGSGDEVRCFQCGGGLKNWEVNDDPWAEHAYWFPSCQYVMQCKGQEFIDMVQAMRTRLDVTEQERHVSHNVNRGAQSSVNGTATNNNVTSYELPRQRTFKDDSDRALITTFIEMGFGRDLVLLALRKVTKNEIEGTSIMHDQVLEYLLQNIVPEKTDISPSTETKTSMKIKGTHNDKSRNDAKPKSTSVIDIKDVVEENYALKQQMTCKVCMDSAACVVFLPCGHMVTCEKCACALRKCAICRARIQGNVRAIIS